jgi:hypothetical protein
MVTNRQVVVKRAVRKANLNLNCLCSSSVVTTAKLRRPTRYLFWEFIDKF